MATTQGITASRTRARLRNRRDFLDAMTFNRLNVRELAELCGRSTHQHTISHLRSGTRNTCSVHLARRIEEVLRERPGALFELSVSSDSLVTATPTRGRRAA